MRILSPSAAPSAASLVASGTTAAPVPCIGDDPRSMWRGRSGELRPAVASGRSRTRLAAGIAAVLACGTLGLPAPAHATATSYERGVSSVNTGATTATSLNLAAPATLMVGDLMVLEIDATGATAIATPTGWTSLGATTSNIGYYQVAYKIAVAGDLGTTYALGLGATPRQAAARIVAFLGVNTASPIEASAFGTGTSTTASFTAITTTVANSLVITGTAASLAASLPSITPLSGTHDLLTDDDTASTWLATDESYYNKSGAASTGTTSSTIAPSSNWRTSNIAIQPAASGALQFGSVPALPASLPSLTLNGQAQTLTTAMTNFDVDDTTGSWSGWNVTVQGATGGGLSPVFAQYCPNATCGTDAGPGYVAGGRTLPAGSLTLSSTGASWVGHSGAGGAPTFSCASGCALDSATPTTIATAAAVAGIGGWETQSFGASSLSLATPTTIRTLQTNEVYEVNLVWTLSSGP